MTIYCFCGNLRQWSLVQKKKWILSSCKLAPLSQNRVSILPWYWCTFPPTNVKPKSDSVLHYLWSSLFFATLIKLFGSHCFMLIIDLSHLLKPSIHPETMKWVPDYPLSVIQKLKLFYNSLTLLQGIDLEELKSWFQKELHLYIQRSLSYIANPWKQPKCSSMDEWEKKM